MTKAQRSLAMLVGFGVIAGAVGFLAYQGAADDVAGRSENEEDLPAFDIDSSRIVRLTARQGEDVTKVERRDHGWWITAPSVLRADESEIKLRIQTLKTLKPKVRFGVGDAPPPPADAAAGLVTPEVSLLAERDDGKTFLLEVGAKSPFDGALYAKATGPDNITHRITVSGGLANRITAPWNAVRDMRILATERNRVVRVKVTPRAPSEEAIAFEATAKIPDMSLPAFRRKIRFELTEPLAGGASNEALTAVFHTLGKSRMSEAYAVDGAANLAELGFDDPLYTVEVDVMTLSNRDANRIAPETRVIKIVPHPDRPSEALLVMRGDEKILGAVAREVEVGLRQTVANLETKQIVHLDRDAVDRVELTMPGGAPHVILERRDMAQYDDPVWQMLAPAPARARTAKVATVLVLFAELEGTRQKARGKAAQSSAVLKETGLDNPIVLKMQEGEAREATLLIGEPEGSAVGYAMRKGSDVIVEVQRSKISAIPRSVVELRDAL